MKVEGVQTCPKLQLWLDEFITENKKCIWNPEQTPLLRLISEVWGLFVTLFCLQICSLLPRPLRVQILPLKVQ